MINRAILFLLGLMPLMLSGRAQAQLDVTRAWFSPPVVSSESTAPVRFEATVTGGPSTVTFLYNSVDRPMYDDGTNGDVVSGDGTYTIQFTANEIISKLTTARVFRPVIGTCRLNTTALQLNVIGEVWTPAIGIAPVSSLAADAQRTDYVINFTATKLQFMTFNASTWAQKLYTYFGDKFDFINFVQVQGMRGNRFHFGVRNAVSGIGMSIYNNGATYGSAARLKGCNVFPMPSFFDGANRAFIHETGHQWVNFLQGTAYASGVPHWPKGSIATNVMGFSLSTGAGGNFNYVFTPNTEGGYLVGNGAEINHSLFNAMELYLMGLVPPEEVPDYFVLVNQNQNISSGQTLTASDISPVTLSSIIAAKGARSPDSNTSQRIFRFATVVLSEQLLDPEALSFYDYFARRIEATTQVTFADGLSAGTTYPFLLATGGRAYAQARITGEQPSDLALSAATVPEDVAPGTDVGIFTTSDTDAGDIFTYTFVNGPGGTDNNAFSITGSSLRINVSPDFETKASYQIRVRTTDSFGLYFDKAFTINVTRTLTIHRQILGLAHHFTPPSTFPYFFPGYVNDELLIENLPLTDVDLSLYDNIKLRLYLPGGSLAVNMPTGTTTLTGNANVTFVAASDAISLSSTALLMFEGQSGAAPVNTYNFAGLGNGGNALSLIRSESWTEAAGFSAWCYLFTPSNHPTNSPKTFSQGSGSSLPVSFSYSTTSITDPGAFVTITSPLVAFRQANFAGAITSINAADIADPDHDNIPNLAEFAFGLDPNSGASNQLPQPIMIGGNFVTSFTQPSGVGGVIYGLEWSQTLEPGSWTPIPDTGTGGQHIFSIPVGNNTQMFIRLTVAIQLH